MPPYLPVKALRALVRLIAACVLMALAVWLVGPAHLAAQWARADRAWFFAAVASAGLAQALSVLRWASIARIFALRVRVPALALAYAQGMTLNVLLPGATLSGDALRSVRLQGLGNPLGVAALTVLLDRLSGLWVLCVLSLCTGLILAARVGAHTLGSAVALPGSATGGLPGLDPAQWVWVYLAGLALLCALPLLPWRVRAGADAGSSCGPAAESTAGSTAGLTAGLTAGPAAGSTAASTAGSASGPGSAAAGGWLDRAGQRLAGLHELVLAQRRPLARSLWASLLVQVLCAVTLWLCVLAAGGKAGYWQVQAVAAPVFVAGALPLSYGGFGARELVALAAFPLVGLSGDLGVAASVLYGVVAIVLGIAAAPSFALVHRQPAPTPGN